MNFKLNFDVPKSDLNLTHKDSIVLVGSCFSDEMAVKFKSEGYTVLDNPFGTLFHPEAIANQLKAALNESKEISIFQREDLFFSWDSASKLYGKSAEALIDKVMAERNGLRTELKHAKVLVITFGSAYGYRHKALNCIVGNCHKASANQFEKELSSVESLSKTWLSTIKKLEAHNPNLKIIFTVSPVRHVKDGLVENNRSKARLIELTHQLTQETNCSYFAAYEILIDELRDYRFYSSDLVHPSAEAVNYIWDKFSESVFSDTTQALNAQISQVNRELSHRTLHPDSLADTKRIKAVQEKKETLSKTHPNICWL